jgi:hypothetical protein
MDFFVLMYNYGQSLFSLAIDIDTTTFTKNVSTLSLFLPSTHVR